MCLPPTPSTVLMDGQAYAEILEVSRPRHSQLANQSAVLSHPYRPLHNLSSLVRHQTLIRIKLSTPLRKLYEQFRTFRAINSPVTSMLMLSYNISSLNFRRKQAGAPRLGLMQAVLDSQLKVGFNAKNAKNGLGGTVISSMPPLYCDPRVSTDFRSKHMKRHTRPYGCTYRQCNKTFGSKVSTQSKDSCSLLTWLQERLETP
jgi:hypothetical protein